MSELNGHSALKVRAPLFCYVGPALRVRSMLVKYALAVLVARNDLVNRHGNSPRVLPESVNSQQ